MAGYAVGSSARHESPLPQAQGGRPPLPLRSVAASAHGELVRIQMEELQRAREEQFQLRKDLAGTIHIVGELALTMARLEEQLSRHGHEDQGDGTIGSEVGVQLAPRIPQQGRPGQASTQQAGGRPERPLCPHCQRRHWGVCRKMRRACFACGKPGHRAAACPSKSPRSQEPYATKFQEYPACSTCRKRHLGECQKGTGFCFHCGKPGHRLNACPRNGSSQPHRGRPVLQEAHPMMPSRLPPILPQPPQSTDPAV